MPTRISLRRVGFSTRKLMAVPGSLAELLENATKKLKLPSGAISIRTEKGDEVEVSVGGHHLTCAPLPRPTDQPLTTLSASKHDRPTDEQAVVRDLGWQLSKTPRRGRELGERDACTRSHMAATFLGQFPRFACPHKLLRKFFYCISLACLLIR